MTRREADRQLAAALERHKQGDVAFAYDAYIGVLKHHPEHPTALHYLGLVAQQTGHTREAIRLLRRSIELDDTDPRAFNHLGQIILAEGRTEEATVCFERALTLDPCHVDSLNNLGNVLKLAGRLPPAIELYRRALKIDARSTLNLYNMANALKEAAEYEEAIQTFEQVLVIAPDHAPAHLNLAVLLEQRGLFDQAVEHYRKVLDVTPDHAKALSNLLSIRSHRPDSQFLDAAEQSLEAAELESYDRIKLHQGLGKHYDREKKFDQAFRHFAAANKVMERRKAPYDSNGTTKYIDAIISAFSADYFSELEEVGAPSEQPVFIVGMPRSGTTLTEQILASHSGIFGAGELQDIPRIAKHMSPPYPAGMTSMSSQALAELASSYLHHLEQQAPSTAMRITDKLPVNFLHLGLIATLFPRCRIVHCRRDPLDIGLSCFIEIFDISGDFTTNLTNFGHYFLQYARLMRHWCEVLPLSLHELRYERLVADQEGETRKLIQFMGLPWEVACLDFHHTDRTVLTPSRWQVRQPLYSTSCGRSRHYAAHLEPLERVLEEHGYRY